MRNLGGTLIVDDSRKVGPWEKKRSSLGAEAFITCGKTHPYEGFGVTLAVPVPSRSSRREALVSRLAGCRLLEIDSFKPGRTHHLPASILA